jgi:hypothetical protein
MKLALRNQSRSLPSTTNQRKNTLTGISILNRAADAIIHGLLSQVAAVQRILDVLSTNRKLGVIGATSRLHSQPSRKLPWGDVG